MEPARFVPVARLGDVSRARIVAARLGADDIEVRIHSEALGPYPVTVGELARAELWVPADRADEARRILLEADVDEVIRFLDEPETSAGGLPIEYRIVALGLVVVVVGAVLLRLMRVF